MNPFGLLSQPFNDNRKNPLLSAGGRGLKTLALHVTYWYDVTCNNAEVGYHEN